MDPSCEDSRNRLNRAKMYVNFTHGVLVSSKYENINTL